MEDLEFSWEDFEGEADYNVQDHASELWERPLLKEDIVCDKFGTRANGQISMAISADGKEAVIVYSDVDLRGQYFEWTRQLFGIISPKRVIILKALNSSMPDSLLDFENGEIRVLRNSHANKDSLNILKVALLSQPSFVEGLGAAVMTQCEAISIPAYLFVGSGANFLDKLTEQAPTLFKFQKLKDFFVGRAQTNSTLFT
ncbi:hypothetical protein HDU76_013483 [Blyttiomyces sp. JEL0837]|nr:hypothetical protein HDU76_013483 [Blyttiomyces sp. JEL0837]